MAEWSLVNYTGKVAEWSLVNNIGKVPEWSLVSNIAKVPEWSLVNNHRESARVKLRKCGKAEWGEHCFNTRDILFDWPHFSFVLLSYYLILYWEKLTSYEEFSCNLTLEVQIVRKIPAF